MTGHKDIPDEVVKRAQLYDYEHWRDDRSSERPRSWRAAPPDQVRRLLFGAYGGGPVTLRQSLTTRQGRKVARMLYRQTGGEPADDDPIIGLVDTPELAALIVAAVNACSPESIT
jgi:hypothetical protein